MREDGYNPRTVEMSFRDDLTGCVERITYYHQYVTNQL
jgi:hypothetical protein